MGFLGLFKTKEERIEKKEKEIRRITADIITYEEMGKTPSTATDAKSRLEEARDLLEKKKKELEALKAQK